MYHGGLKAPERHHIQDRFMAGVADVIVATNPFGMGIDKPNICFVYPCDVSDSVDSYYQEIGRARRDEEKAEAVLSFRDEDIGAQAFKTAERRLDQKQVELVAAAIASQDGPVVPEEIVAKANLSERKLTSAIRRLEDLGALELSSAGELRLS